MWISRFSSSAITSFRVKDVFRNQQAGAFYPTLPFTLIGSFRRIPQSYRARTNCMFFCGQVALVSMRRTVSTVSSCSAYMASICVVPGVIPNPGKQTVFYSCVLHFDKSIPIAPNGNKNPCRPRKHKTYRDSYFYSNSIVPGGLEVQS